MKFNNRPNKSYKIYSSFEWFFKLLSKIFRIKYKEIWESRSPALVGVVIAKNNGRNYVLIGQRGPGAADYQGLWNVPCGYLDWDESGTQGITREIYEETGLNVNVNDITDYNIINWDLTQPFYVNTNPSENRQNVSLSYGMYFECNELPTLTNEHCEPGEVSRVKWANVNDLNLFNFAFGHDERIKSYLNHINI